MTPDADYTLPKVGARYLLNAREYEVSSLANDVVTLRGLDSKSTRYLQNQDFIDHLRDGTIKISMPAPISSSDLPTVLGLSEKQRKSYERRVAYVIRMDHHINHSMPKNIARELIENIAKSIGDTSPPSYETVTRWLKSYHQAGGNPLRLVDQRKGKGRRKRIEPDAIAIINEYVKDEFLKETRPSAQLVYNLAKAQMMIDNTQRPLDKQITIPSRATFYRMIANLDPLYTDIKRVGKVAAKKLHKYGRSIHKTTHPCERVEIDCNLMDVLVINETTMQIEGRPWLCAMLDVDSRCIIGWEISFTPPCAAKTLRALRVAMNADSDIEVGGAPEEIVMDNGAEFRNQVLQLITGSYGIQIRYVAPRSPDEKPFIERFFGTLNSTFIHLMPGTTRSSPAARGLYSSERNATFTLQELRNKFASWLTSIYHATPHSELGMPPIEAWRQRIKLYPPKRYPANDLDLACRPFAFRSISDGRVSFMNLQWTGPTLSFIESRAKSLKQGTKVKVYYDESDLSYVLIEDPTDKTILVRADAVDPDYQNGLSVYEHNLIMNKRRLDYKNGDDINLAKARLEFYRELSESNSTANTRKIIARLGKTPRHLQDAIDMPPPPEQPVSEQPRSLTQFTDDDEDYEEIML